MNRPALVTIIVIESVGLILVAVYIVLMEL